MIIGSWPKICCWLLVKTILRVGWWCWLKQVLTFSKQLNLQVWHPCWKYMKFQAIGRISIHSFTCVHSPSQSVLTQYHKDFSNIHGHSEQIDTDSLLQLLSNRACSCRLYSDGFALYIKTDSLIVIISNTIDCCLIKYHNDANLQRLIVFDSMTVWDWRNMRSCSWRFSYPDQIYMFDREYRFSSPVGVLLCRSL